MHGEIVFGMVVSSSVFALLFGRTEPCYRRHRAALCRSDKWVSNPFTLFVLARVSQYANEVLKRFDIRGLSMRKRNVGVRIMTACFH